MMRNRNHVLCFSFCVTLLLCESLAGQTITIPSTLFGTHQFSQPNPSPPMGWFGTVRLWNSNTTWRLIDTLAQATVTRIERNSSNVCSITVDSNTGWTMPGYIYISGLTGTPDSSLNGVFQISNVFTDGNGPHISMNSCGTGTIAGHSVTGAHANYYYYKTLDDRLATAHNEGHDTIFTFGEVPPRYATDPSAVCPNVTTGTCSPPSDLLSDGSGANQHWRDFVIALALHISSLSSSTYARPLYFETWNEMNISSYWQGQNAQIVRLMDDLTCILKGTGTIHGLNNESCSADANLMGHTGIWTSAQILSASLSRVGDLTFWNNYLATPGATANADILAVHTYDYGDNSRQISTIGRSGSTVTVITTAPHGFTDNTVLMVSGVSPSDFNGQYSITGDPMNNKKFTYTASGTQGAGAGANKLVQNAPEQLLTAIPTFLAPVPNKPLWVTEGQWIVNGGTTDPPTQQGFAMRWIATLAAANVARSYWFGWDGSGALWENPKNHTLDIRCDGVGGDPSCIPPLGWVTPAGRSYNTAKNWMLSKNITANTGCSLVTNPGTVWQCIFTDPSTGVSTAMMWDSSQDNTNGATKNANVSNTYTHYYDWTGALFSISGNIVPLGAIPILLVP